MKKNFLSVVLVILALGTVLSVNAQTASGYVLTNRATVFGANIASNASATQNTVQTIFGAGAGALIDSITGTAGVITSNVIRITNYGNATTTMTLRVKGTEAQGTLGGTWDTWFKDTAGGATSNTTQLTVSIAAGGVATVYFYVRPNVSAMSSVTRYTLYVAAASTANTTAVRYQGDQAAATYYGGWLGSYNPIVATGGYNSSAGQAWVVGSTNSSPRLFWSVTIGQAAITLAKSATVSNRTATAWAGTLVPGATITYVITYTVTGTANNVYVIDYLPTNTTFVTGSAMVNGVTQDATANSGDRCELVGSQLYFYLGTGATDVGNVGGTVTANGNFRYQVTVN